MPKHKYSIEDRVLNLIDSKTKQVKV